MRDAWDALRPFSTGGNYINFQTADEGEDRIRATYGANYERLLEVKRSYDPSNLFRSTATSARCASVRPSASAAVRTAGAIASGDERERRATASASAATTLPSRSATGAATPSTPGWIPRG